MLISCVNGSDKIRFYPENRYDCFCLGQLKTKLDNNGSSYKLEFSGKGPGDIKAIEFQKEDAIHLIIR